tara:strand:+ start:4126 stop:4365 length:240 start_codon:yes stop_codon:yes gene_type:complete
MTTIEVGDLVYWTLDPEGRYTRKPLPHDNKNLWIGIVTKKALRGIGIEVYWFNNGIFKTMNADSVILATNFGVKESRNN